ncbi:MAG: SCO family protein [Candidatus Hydrogenedentes bacterium]|nr:SCO family protein [Candidatus Hydrogenedentota bacterium]
MSARKLPALVLVCGSSLLLAALFFLGFVLASRPAEAPASALPVLGALPEFTLTSAEGTPFDTATLKEKIWVTAFFFTSCAGPCPVLTKQMGILQETFRDAPDVALVSITVDPETDSPERLKAYGLEHKADFARWHFLTGSMDAIRRAAVDAYKIGSVDDPMIHSTRLTLTDRHGNIRGYYNGLLDEDMVLLQNAIRTLLEEPVE